MAALVAVHGNAVLEAFYHRLLQKGKPRKLALTVAMRKLLVILNRSSKPVRPGALMPSRRTSKLTSLPIPRRHVEGGGEVSEPLTSETSLSSSIPPFSPTCADREQRAITTATLVERPAIDAHGRDGGRQGRRFHSKQFRCTPWSRDLCVSLL